MTEEQLKEEGRLTRHNRYLIGVSKICGCYNCRNIFTPSDITQWTMDETAICPMCGVDSVACGPKVNFDFLSEMKAYWFNEPECFQ